ncbi:hypothetical protein Tco_1492677 [Tanacetum coccineum]
MDKECLFETKIAKKAILQETKGAQVHNLLKHMETNDAQDDGRTKEMVDEEKSRLGKDLLVMRRKISSDEQEQVTGRPFSSHSNTCAVILKMMKTIAKVLLNISQAKAVSREKEKGVELREVKDAERPRPTSQRSLLTLKPLPKIDPKDKGKKKIDQEFLLREASKSKERVARKFLETRQRSEAIQKKKEKRATSPSDYIRKKQKPPTKKMDIQATGEEIQGKNLEELEVKEEILEKRIQESRKIEHGQGSTVEEVDYEILDKKYPIIDWKTENLGTKPQFDESKKSEEINMNVPGKGDYSNLLIADSLLKTIWFINAPCYDNEALASPNTNDEELSIPEQTATGKGTLNPLMAGSLPKTTKPTPKGLVHLLYVIKSPQSSMSIACDFVACGRDLFAFIRTIDPTKVRVGERQRGKDKPKLLDTTVGRTVPLLSVAHARAKSELNASVDCLFNEEGEPVPTFPFVTSFVSATSKREEGDHIDSLVGANLRTIRAQQRFVISSDSSHHSGTHVAETEVDYVIRSSAPAMITATIVTAMADIAAVIKESVTKPSLFTTASSSAGGTEPTLGGFSDLTGSDFLAGDIRTVVDPDSDLQKVYVSRWYVTNGSLLDDSRVCREMVDEFAPPPQFFASVRGMEHDQLFDEFNVGAARQMTLGAEVRMRAEYNIKEKRKLKFVAEEKDILLNARDKEIKSLKAQLLMKEAEAAEAIHRNTGLEKERIELAVKVTAAKSQSDDLAGRVHKLETSSAGLQEKVATYEDFIDQIEKFQDEQMEIVHEKFNKLDADFIETCLHLEEKFYPHLLTTIAGRRWLLTYGMKLAVLKCLNSPEYLSAIGASISKAIEKGMQDGNFISALQEVQNVNFSLLVELRSNKDASVETIMGLLRLDEALAEKLGLNESQPHVDQLMVPVHHSPDQTVIGARALSLSLDVSYSRVQRIRENIANDRSALYDVFVSFSEPLSAVVLEGTGVLLMLLLITIPPISIDDYQVVHVDGQEGIVADVNPFPNVEDMELNVSE